MREGIEPKNIFVTGSPLSEVFDYFRKDIDSSKVLEDLKLDPKKYFLVSTHREENVDNENRLEELFNSFEGLVEKYNFPVLVSLHPRTKKRLEEQKIKVGPKIILSKPLGYIDYCKLQKNAYCTLSDSGTVQEESAILDFPAIQIRVSTERPEAFDKGTIILTGFNKDSILNAIDLTVSVRNDGEKTVMPEDYKDLNVSTKVVKLIMGLSGIAKFESRKI